MSRSPVLGPLTKYDSIDLSFGAQDVISRLVASLVICRRLNGCPSVYSTGHDRKGGRCPVLWGRCVRWAGLECVVGCEGLG